MKAYTLTMKWNHRKWGPQHSTWRINATSVTTAIARGTREWMKQQESKTRRDAGKQLSVTAVYLGPAIDVDEVKADVDAAIEVTR